MGNTREITGKFAINYIVVGCVIGIIGFLLENMLPKMFNLDYGIATMLIQTGIFFVCTLLIGFIVISASFGKKKVNEKDAATVVKSTRVILIIIAIIVMFLNFFYCWNLLNSEYKDINDSKGKYSDYSDSEKDDAKKETKEVTAIYMVVKEIVTIGSYILVASFTKSYIDKRIDNNIEESEDEE